ncbi:hypothetical protein SLEP1_g56301 [Rubroshorea leprosula]|uniref:Wall-associated receptor kinase galacturonan-binding domain-containing protein n=1 Tax=Rubroshorea leprosula TaxID=152421 RepID=A0AAV5MK96_9ROSI|nr:hypothetical protein SLEP1_g56301 [Rubroshorea leprosula]
MIESAGGQALAMPGCQEFCGNVSIPYPFGIGTDCYMNKWFEVSCNETSTPPTTLLTSIEIEVLYFSLDSSLICCRQNANNLPELVYRVEICEFLRKTFHLPLGLPT